MPKHAKKIIADATRASNDLVHLDIQILLAKLFYEPFCTGYLQHDLGTPTNAKSVALDLLHLTPGVAQVEEDCVRASLDCHDKIALLLFQTAHELFQLTGEVKLIANRAIAFRNSLEAPIHQNLVWLGCLR